VSGWRVAVIVPAHNESVLLPACLAALHADPVPKRLIVVADACTDDTAALAVAAGAEVVTIEAGNVGRARAAGVTRALDAGPRGLWLATTDADSRVPPGWLDRQLRHAVAGADLVAGTVVVDDWSGWPSFLEPRYQARYRRAMGSHVHGANLGFSAAAYLAAGGFPALTHDEDRALAARVRSAGGRVVTDGGCPVRTSARPDGRTPYGFAGHLLGLAAEAR